MKSLTCLSLAAAFAAAVDINCGMYTFTAHYDSATSEIVMETTQPDQSWFAILLGSSSMTNTEAIVFFGDGASSSAKNYHSTGHVKPTLASTQSVTSTVTTSSQTITMTTRRALDPAVAQQFSIPLDTDITMGYATNDQTNSLNTVHNLFGSWTFNLASDGSSSGGTGGGGSSNEGEDDSDDEAEDESDDD